MHTREHHKTSRIGKRRFQLFLLEKQRVFQTLQAPAWLEQHAWMTRPDTLQPAHLIILLEIAPISLGQGGQNAWSPPSQICSLLPKNVSLGGNWSPRIIYETFLCEQQVCYAQRRPQEALQVCSPSLPSHPRGSLRSSSYLGAHTHEGAEPEVHLGSVLPAQQGSLCQREYRAAE